MDKQEKVLKEILELCKDLEPFKILVLGQLLHKYSKAVLEGLKEYIKEKESKKVN